MNFIVTGLLLREALDRHRVRLNMYLVHSHTTCLYVQELVRALAEDKADIHLDPVLYRACAVDLKGACRDVPRGNGRRKFFISASLQYRYSLISSSFSAHHFSCFLYP